MVVAQRRLTLEEFLKLPERKPARQYFDGKVTRKMAPKMRHSALQVDLTQFFNDLGRARKLVRAFSELRTTFAGVSVVPDVTVFRWARIPVDAHGELEDEVFLPADVAIEIASPRQSRVKLRDRCRFYVEHGVQLALLVDPRPRTVTRFDPGQPERVLRGADLVDYTDILPGAQITVDDLFASLRLG